MDFRYYNPWGFREEPPEPEPELLAEWDEAEALWEARMADGPPPE